MTNKFELRCNKNYDILYLKNFEIKIIIYTGFKLSLEDKIYLIKEQHRTKIRGH